MFHNVGHIVSYRDILRIDTALAAHTLSSLSSMDTDTGSIIPTNLTEKRFIHFSADNIDINEETLDGQNTFRATQYAAWQKGQESGDLLQNITPTQQRSLKIPEEIHAGLPVYIREGGFEPEFQTKVCEQWFQQKLSECPAAQKDVATDTAFHLSAKV